MLCSSLARQYWVSRRLLVDSLLVQLLGSLQPPASTTRIATFSLSLFLCLVISIIILQDRLLSESKLSKIMDNVTRNLLVSITRFFNAKAISSSSFKIEKNLYSR